MKTFLAMFIPMAIFWAMVALLTEPKWLPVLLVLVFMTSWFGAALAKTGVK